jgi:DUF1365 family protein
VSWQSQIYRGQVVHQRMGPVEHTFTYPVTFFAFHPSELRSIATHCSLFSYNQPGILRLNDADYLYGQRVPIGAQIAELLGAESAGEYTRVVTSPRYLNYAFNPVNFHLRMQGQELRSVVAEVNNTFGDRHVYVLKDLQRGDSAYSWRTQCLKDFHVSPFNDMSGEYHFSFRIKGNEVYLGVDLYRGGECVLKTWIEGRGVPIHSMNIVRHALLHPFDTALNSMPRIIWQAAQLYYKKKLRIYQRPSPNSSQTLIDRDKPRESHTVI